MKKEVRPYGSEYENDIYRLWNKSGTAQGYIPATREDFEEILVRHPYFTSMHAFVLLEDGSVNGFICGCEGEELVQGNVRGYFTCLLIDAKEPKEAIHLLLQKLEKSFCRCGKRILISNCFNPIRLPWVISKEEGAVHNNAPGIALNSFLYEGMKKCGYKDIAHECAMYLNLGRIKALPNLPQKEQKAREAGYTVEWYDKEHHIGLKEMVDALGNPVWSAEVPIAAEEINMLVAVKENEVVGFAGPIYPEKSGRGYFAGIAISKQHEKHGLGTLLFYRLCQEEKRAGAEYMSLFTGEENRAQNIYRNMGFEVRRVFSVMVKELRPEEY